MFGNTTSATMPSPSSTSSRLSESQFTGDANDDTPALYSDSASMSAQASE